MAQDFWLAEDCPANPVARHSKDAANGSPSPGGEGRDEGERPNHYYSYPIRDGISVATRDWPCQQAVLKPPHSRRWRNRRTSPNFAKRLDCGAFTAAIARPFPQTQQAMANDHRSRRSS